MTAETDPDGDAAEDRDRLSHDNRQHQRRPLAATEDGGAATRRAASTEAGQMTAETDPDGDAPED
jgi:YD repeat-containing protein